MSLRIPSKDIVWYTFFPNKTIPVMFFTCFEQHGAESNHLIFISQVGLQTTTISRVVPIKLEARLS